VELQPVWLGPPALPLGGPLRGNLILGQALPRAHMHLAKAVVDPRFEADQRCKRSCRRHRPPQGARHDRANILAGQRPCHGFCVWPRGQLDRLVDPPHHSLLRIRRGAPMPHEMNESHRCSMPRQWVSRDSAGLVGGSVGFNRLSNRARVAASLEDSTASETPHTLKLSIDRV